MTSLTQLHAYTNELVAAVQTVAEFYPNANTPHSPSQLVPPDAPSELRRARRTILANVTKLKTLLEEPADLLQQLACQNQMLACLQWLGEFQVLACIPLSDSVSIKDIADLSGVPETHLHRVIRMTATSGFLKEPQPGYVSHTNLSAPFVTKPLFLDAGMFLAKSSGLASLQMAAATQRFGKSNRPHESAYSLAFNTSETFQSVCDQRLKVGAQSPRIALGLVERYPALQLIVQMSEPGLSTGVGSRQRSSNSTPSLPASSREGKWASTSPKEVKLTDLGPRITVQKRIPDSLQTVSDAAVYIVSVPSPSPTLSSHIITERLASDLRAHLGVLRANCSATLILTMCPLPEPSTVDPDIEASARQRDLTLFQLANDHRLELTEVENIINDIWDTMGRLAIVNKLRSWKDATIALGVKYQVSGNHQRKTQATLSTV
ncbi:O-methyltransferase [Hyphodiscus hymeniophilus]|uniref:O-methyltransferase n=1 Tax=Hyphodiscus hymeniophilus TaxID=353542 RepID=A0A9P7AYR2_9HELO|nr:O-methyltransferase [Hyphodiscus hymeniophilus]